MKKSAPLLIGVAATGILFGAITAAVHAQARRSGPDAGTVNTLDRLCQERFQTIDMKSFGISRIPTTPEHRDLVRIKPESQAEKAVVADLKRDGWDGLLMVAGQSAVGFSKYMRQHPEALEAVKKEKSNDLFGHGRTISKPVVLTGAKPQLATPASYQLLSSMSDAFSTASRRGSYEFKAGDWYVVARPIRAGKKECLSCHKQNADGQKVKVGDAVGLALYAFSRPKVAALQ